jgi:hypothetical protein
MQSNALINTDITMTMPSDFAMPIALAAAVLAVHGPISAIVLVPLTNLVRTSAISHR